MKMMLAKPFTTRQLDSRADSRRPPVLLVVDGDMNNIERAKTVFGQDHEVVFVNDGLRALEFCREQLPDLILLAWTLPAMSGHETCLKLRDDPVTRYLPVIFLTDDDNAEDEVQGLDAGAVDFIVRPVGAAVWRARVKTHLMLRQKTKQILAFNATLERKVEERTVELSATMETLHDFHGRLVDSEARATLSTVVANVSHELTTPISNGLLTANMLSDHAKNFHALVDSGRLKLSELGLFLKVLGEGTALMERNLNRANNLIGSFKQVAIDQVSEEHREFDLAETVKDVVASVMPGLKSKPHRIVIEIPDGIMMNSLPGRLGQVVINLINNAYLHAFEGRRDGALIISAVLDGDHIQLSFSDNGVGMSEENLARLFQPFFTTKKGNGGTGLGMPIVDNLVRKSLGGSIKVNSKLGEGTTLLVRLPVAAQTIPRTIH